ncbi:MAG: FGGY family carbohydrate kinase [Firmicutes bacterium]|jgi:sugar (pentulose or hexulose) kinase|nr:FGGY family carbohydrate kinase [Bacillota bacterium]MDH7495723.1 FGGY-family carbohydrate kinase [Bacillota bacterium]
MSLLGLDIGTTGCKAAIFSQDGQVIGYSFKEYGYSCPYPKWAEQDPLEVMAAVREVIGGAVASVTRNDPVTVIGLSVQGDAIIPVDSHMNIIYPAILGMDARTEEECRWLDDKFGAHNIFRHTGMPIHPLNALTKIMWLKNNRPDVFEKTWKFLHYEEFVLAMLGGEPLVDLSMASRTMAFDISAGEWSSSILDAVGIPSEKLGTVVPSGHFAGRIAPELARELGLPKGVSLATGGHDQTCAALGAGVVREKMATVSTGTAEVMGIPFERPILSDEMLRSKYPCYYHVVPGIYFTITLNHTGGLLLRWYRDTFGHLEAREAAESGCDVYDLIISRVPKDPSHVLFLPHLVGSGTPWSDPKSKGAVVGLTLGTTRYDVVKGILDSLTYELKINLDTLYSLGVEVRELRAVGGGAKSPAWLQVKADVLGVPVATLAVREAACLGAALLGGLATGVFTSLTEAVDQLVRTEAVYTPDYDRHEMYLEKYDVYRSLYPALRPICHRI